jgi:hypothetical protein
MWFFLIGYARSRDLGPTLWTGLAVLIAANVMTGMSVFPLNILATIIFTRLLLDPVMTRALAVRDGLWVTLSLLTILAIPSGLVCEYGTQGLLLAMCGWLLRRREMFAERRGTLYAFLAANALVYCGLEFGFFDFSPPQFYALCLGISAVMAGLYRFRPLVYPRLTRHLPPLVSGFFRLCGRYTAEIYVVHLCAFKFLALYLGDPRFGWLGWKIFSLTGT